MIVMDSLSFYSKTFLVDFDTLASIEYEYTDKQGFYEDCHFNNL